MNSSTPEPPKPAEAPLSLSILVPTWNRVRCLEELLPRLMRLLEEEPRVDLIVSNNSSTDGTKPFLDGLPPHPRLRIIHQPINYGIHLHLSWLYGQAGGKYLWLFGDDDLFEPGLPGEILAQLQARPDLAWLHVPHQYASPHGPPKLSRCPDRLLYVPQSRVLFPQYMHWLTLISSNIIRSSVLHRQLPALTLANAFWPTLLLMNSVADLPGSVLPTRQVTAGPDITWSDRAKEIGCVQMPVAILGSPLLSPQEKRGCLREHYLIEPECLDGLLALRPGFFLRLAWFDPGLCNVAFLKRLPRKVLARFRRRPTPGQS